jgi:hypothetical protein
MGEYLHLYIELGFIKVYTHMYIMDKSMKRWTSTPPKIDKPFGVRFHLENFWEPMLVGVEVILLVGGDKTLYIPIEFGNSWGLRMY